MTVLSPPISVEAYAMLPDEGPRTEFIDGEVIELATGNFMHTLLRDEALFALKGLGSGVAAVEVEFRTSANRVRRADVVWYALGRLTAEDLRRNILPAPDLVVEVVSPNDTADEVRNKVHEYLDAGVNTVWLLYSARREADVWSADGTMKVVTQDLTAECLPGVSIPLGTLHRTSL